MNKTCWALTTKGMGCVGQDEIIILLTLNSEDEDTIPRDIFLQLHYIYQEASKGNLKSLWHLKGPKKFCQPVFSSLMTCLDYRE